MLFENGIVNLTTWLGNVILPTLSGLFFAIAIVRFVGPGQHQNWMYGGFLCLMASGILRALEVFSYQQAWDNPDLYWMSLVNLVNWICNVMMPLYGVLQIVVGIMAVAGVGHRIYQGGPGCGTSWRPPDASCCPEWSDWRSGLCNREQAG